MACSTRGRWRTQGTRCTRWIHRLARSSGNSQLVDRWWLAPRWLTAPCIGDRDTREPVVPATISSSRSAVEGSEAFDDSQNTAFDLARGTHFPVRRHTQRPTAHARYLLDRRRGWGRNARGVAVRRVPALRRRLGSRWARRPADCRGRQTGGVEADRLLRAQSLSRRPRGRASGALEAR